MSGYDSNGHLHGRDGKYQPQRLAEPTGITGMDEPALVDYMGDCPDCGAPMGGVIGGNGDRPIRLPGSRCTNCPHTVASIEVETEPAYDEDGRTYVYALEDDATIRITDDDGDTVDLYRPGTAEWESNLTTFGVTAGNVNQALNIQSDPYSYTSKRAEEAGYAVMATAYDVILDRGNVPEDYLAGSQTSDDDIEAHYSMYLNRAIDKVAQNYAAMAPATAPTNVYMPGSNRAPRPSSMDELRRECEDAGAPSMFAVYQLLADREVLSDFTAKNLTAEEVWGDYENHIAPAIDSLEDRLLNDYNDELPED